MLWAISLLVSSTFWVALILAFFGGVFIGSGFIGIALVIIAFFLGLWAFSTKEKVTLNDVVEFIRDFTGH